MTDELIRQLTESRAACRRFKTERDAAERRLDRLEADIDRLVLDNAALQRENDRLLDQNGAGS